ncbi:hypothetical protein HRbin14_02111 [bacterium HR14]|nr:hypothetical protein HRbin14_02111 [bacterium HR14]
MAYYFGVVRGEKNLSPVRNLPEQCNQLLNQVWVQIAIRFFHYHDASARGRGYPERHDQGDQLHRAVGKEHAGYGLVRQVALVQLQEHRAIYHVLHAHVGHKRQKPSQKREQFVARFFVAENFAKHNGQVTSVFL